LLSPDILCSLTGYVTIHVTVLFGLDAEIVIRVVDLCQFLNPGNTVQVGG